MGYRSSWIAVRKNTAQAALREAELRSTGKWADCLDTGWYAIELSEWYVVIGSGWDYMERLTLAQAKELSGGGRSIFWSADDSSMDARMVEFRDREIVWSLHHEDMTLTVNGEPPEVVHQIVHQVRSACEDQRDAEADDADDCYEVAHMVGKSIVGFRHDELDLPQGLQFIVLRPQDEPEPVRVIEAHDPFAVEFITDHEGVAEVNIEAIKSVHVERFLVLTFGGDQLQGASEHEGGLLAVGDRRQFWLHGPESSIIIAISGEQDIQEIELRIPTA
ncbi:MAG: hypothetical protein H6729_06485 [Deltaproteobacteria bacterium]|nr:hypothetical protein [Deltaproteobacteria bacterium]